MLLLVNMVLMLVVCWVLVFVKGLWCVVVNWLILILKFRVCSDLMVICSGLCLKVVLVGLMRLRVLFGCSCGVCSGLLVVWLGWVVSSFVVVVLKCRSWWCEVCMVWVLWDVVWLGIVFGCCGMVDVKCVGSYVVECWVVVGLGFKVNFFCFCRIDVVVVLLLCCGV